MNKALYLGLSLAVAPFVFQDVAQAVILDFSSTPVVETGEQVSIDIIISDLVNGGAPSLGAYDFDIRFDSSILNFDSVTFGDAVLGNQLDIIGLFGTFNDVLKLSSDTINLFELSLDDPFDLDTFQADSFTLATLTFDAVGAGTSTLEFSNVILGNALGHPLSVTTNQGMVTVEASDAVPVPESSTTFSLLALGLLGLGTVIRRQQKLV